MTTAAPDTAVAARGFRVWRITTDGYLLPYLLDGHRWRPGLNVARCEAGQGHAAPSPGCQCGFNALHEPDRLPHGPGTVGGVVALWGEVDVYARGLRAEKAAVLALERPRLPDEAGSAALAARRYGVPLVHRHELAEAAAPFAAPVVAPLRLPDPPREVPRAGPSLLGWDVAGRTWVQRTVSGRPEVTVGPWWEPRFSAVREIEVTAEPWLWRGDALACIHTDAGVRTMPAPVAGKVVARAPATRRLSRAQGPAVATILPAKWHRDETAFQWGDRWTRYVGVLTAPDDAPPRRRRARRRAS